MKFAISTLGCKVNAFESESYVKTLKDAGFFYVSEKEVADIYIINSCAVTNVAAKKTRQKISQAKRLNDQAIIVVVGCYAQVESEKLIKRGDIDLLIGSNKKSQMLDLLNQVIKGRKITAVDLDKRDFFFEELKVENFQGKNRAFLKVQDGCDQFCSYCIIPFARGKERSQDLKLVLENAEYLINEGYKEIVLSGIHTGRYGRDLNITLKDLMESLLKSFDKLLRLRLSSIEILEVSDEIISLAKKDQRIARHWHIPLQSGCDKILDLMNRRYTTDDYKNRVDKIRRELPNVAISTDVIVGFPNESEEDFLKTYNFIKDLKLSFIHVFPYSAKKNTKAALMENQVSNKIKKARVKKLLALSKKLKNEFMQKFINKTVEVLVESKDENGYYRGYCSEYFEVRFKGKKDLENTFQKVIIEKVNEEVAYGRPI